MAAAGAAQAHEPGIKWEYKILRGNTGYVFDFDEKILNKYGAEGWEMYSWAETPDGAKAFYLRRPYRDDKPSQDGSSASKKEQ